MSSLKNEIENELRNENKSGFLKIFFIIIFIIFIFFLVNYQINKLFININDINNTKEIIFGNINNNKLEKNNFNINILNEDKEFGDIESLRSFLINLNKKIQNYSYSIKGIEGDNINGKELFNTNLLYKDLGFFLNIEEIIKYVKKQILIGNKNIIINIDKYSYIDQKKIIDIRNNLVGEFTKEGGNDIEFDINKGFYTKDENLSFYTLKVIKEDIKKINLSNPTNYKSYIFFKLMDNNINDRIQELNKKFSIYKNLYIDFYIISKNNTNNLNNFKKYLTESVNNKIDNNGIHIIFNGKNNIDNIKYENGILKYYSKDFLLPGKEIKINGTKGKYIVNNWDFFNINNLNILSNYPQDSDFSILNNNNGFIVKTDYINKIMNEYIEYIFLNENEQKLYKKEINVNYIIDNNNVIINKVNGYSNKIINNYFINTINSKKNLYTYDTPLIIKDINETYKKIGKKELIIDGKIYEIFDKIYFDNGNKFCIIIDFDSSKVHLSCSEGFGYEVENNGNINLSYDMFGIEFDLKIEGLIGNLVYNGEKKIFKININNQEKDSKTYIDIINNNYISIDKNIIKKVIYDNGNYYIYFNTKGQWYIKSSTDYDVFFIFFISFK